MAAARGVFVRRERLRGPAARSGRFPKRRSERRSGLRHGPGIAKLPRFLEVTRWPGCSVPAPRRPSKSRHRTRSLLHAQNDARQLSAPQMDSGGHRGDLRPLHLRRLGCRRCPFPGSQGPSLRSASQRRDDFVPRVRPRALLLTEELRADVPPGADPGDDRRDGPAQAGDGRAHRSTPDAPGGATSPPFGNSRRGAAEDPADPGAQPGRQIRRTGALHPVRDGCHGLPVCLRI